MVEAFVERSTQGGNGAKRVLPNYPGEAPTETSGQDWRSQCQHALTSLSDLKKHLTLSLKEREGAERAEQAGFPISVTPYYLSLIDPKDPNCPIRKQCIPLLDESKMVEGDLRDPLGEENHEVAPHLVRRYPDRVLLLATDRCSVYCRFCTRSRMVGAGGGARSLTKLEPAFQWIEAHPEVREVIISGGDPLVMTTGKIVSLLDRLHTIENVDVVRIASRTPVTLPQRITQELCEALAPYPAVWLMTHFNHPKELSEEARAACRRLVDHGIPVMNQTVLLRGINDSAQTLETLFRGLIRNKVRPYYLLQADPVRGTSHLRTPLVRGLEIMEALQGKLSGIALPRFIVDTPGGFGKVPLLPNYVAERGEGRTLLRTYRKKLVPYIDPVLTNYP